MLSDSADSGYWVSYIKETFSGLTFKRLVCSVSHMANEDFLMKIIGAAHLYIKKSIPKHTQKYRGHERVYFMQGFLNLSWKYF